MPRTSLHGVRCVLLMALFLPVAWVGVVVADDLDEPDFRGTPYGIEAHWTPSSDWNVQVYGRPGGNPPGVEVNPTEPSLDERPAQEIDLAPYGVGSTIYTITIPNWIDDEPLKIGRIQLSWLGAITSEPSLLGILGTDGTFGTSPGVVTFHPPTAPHIFTQPDGGATYWDFTIEPNPDLEEFHFNLPATSQLVQIDVDTASIPEPATLCLLIAAAACLLLRRR